MIFFSILNLNAIFIKKITMTLFLLFKPEINKSLCNRIRPLKKQMLTIISETRSLRKFEKGSWCKAVTTAIEQTPEHELPRISSSCSHAPPQVNFRTELRTKSHLISPFFFRTQARGVKRDSDFDSRALFSRKDSILNIRKLIHEWSHVTTTLLFFFITVEFQRRT